MRLARLYAILDLELAATRRLDPDATFQAWLDAGVRLVQLRAKALGSGAFLAMATRMASRAAASGATFVVNDRVDIARLALAAGVHVGQTDLAPSDARLVLTPGAIVGLSTHTSEQAAAAVREPVDYLAIGPVFVTSTKQQPDPVVGLEGVRAAARIAATAGLPLVAIGGITRERAPAVLEGGASSVAVVSDLLQADPGRAARAFLTAVE